MIDLLNSNYDLIDDFITIRGEKIDVKEDWLIKMILIFGLKIHVFTLHL